MASNSRRERERKAHRREILKAAERVFAAKGYHAATVEEIATEAEFAVGTLYNFFGSKEELYREVINGVIGQLYAEAQQRVLSRDDPEQAIAAAIEVDLEYLERHRGLARAVLDATPGGQFDLGQAMPAEATQLMDRYRKEIIGVFGRGVERGVFDALDPFYLALCLEGIIKAFMAYWSRHEPEEPLEVRCAKLKETFIGRIKIRRTDAGAAAEPRVDAGPERTHSP